jgi:UDP-N-acetylmuramate--alanine ligase
MSAQTERLATLGAQIFVGHRAENVKGADVVVYTSAANNDNPELSQARALKIPTIQRAEMLTELMRLKFGVAVAGSHGKTTTTSMIGQMIHDAGLDPTVIVGGRLELFDSTARHGEGKILVAEADESDGSFLHLNPAVAVVTNIDREHMNHYGTMDVLREAFLSFLNKVPFYGCAVVCIDDREVARLIPQARCRVRTYGFSPEAELRAIDLEPSKMGFQFEVLYGEDSLGLFEMPMAGRHNVQNCLAAISVALELNVPIEAARRSLASFHGVDRRLQTLYRDENVWLLDDYGHHPTEIRATLAAIRPHCKGRLVTLFQPHRFSRTKDLWNDFTRCFDGVDTLFLMDIYGAHEPPIPGVEAAKLARDIELTIKRPVIYVGKMPREEIVRQITAYLSPGDTLLTLGAGVTSELAGLLRQHFRPAASVPIYP